MEIANDILVTIPDEDLPKLAEMYKEHEDWLPHAYSVIQTGIEWKRKNNTLLTFMSPNLCWKDDGTFFVVANFNCLYISIFTLDETNKNVYDGFKNTKRFNLDTQRIILYAIHEKTMPALYKVIKETNSKIKFDITCYSAVHAKEEAANLEITLPPEVFIKELTVDLVPQINKLWDRSYPGSEIFLKTLIEMNGGFGLFIKETNELAAWVFITHIGQPGMIQTVDKFKRKGYAFILLQRVSKEIAAEKGCNVFFAIMEKNTASKQMVEKFGSNFLGFCNFVGINLKQN